MTDHSSKTMRTPAGEPAGMPTEQAIGNQATSVQGPGPQSTGMRDVSKHGTGGQSAPADGGHQELAPMFEGPRTKELQDRWHDIQAAFVDDPRNAVRQAGALNDEIVGSLTTALDERKRVLDLGIANGDTEQLRIGMRQYRQMLDQILAL
ncbi:hypothetical protein [Actinomadura macra]|uniref:hypothetical protein n=1 Tax=Actinomadura macra TaxID=46164 RepID=UPI00082CD11C|nr:hypothetical protein [Actinomadura macra]